ncbi:ABC transporter ATP-binding protein [Klebsiella pneumoniae]|uniref:ABC transporter ATP-binding protein n=1 Tax=Klebsiella pneumoniae TaxID=573 RepID=UPI001889A7FE|nr:ABC transporter ATP-binding protein [Klebsiella pneumoniae]
MTYAVEFQNVSRLYGDVRAVDGVSIGIRDGEFFFGQPASELPPWQRDVNTVFQDYALFPHMSILDNVAYGLMVKGMAKKARHARAQEALEKVALVALRHAKAHAAVLLLDEPLGALDLKLREQMQVELKKLQQSLGITFIFVTHDQSEALSMSDRVAVFNNGRIEQVDAPQDLYLHPRTAFVAGFVGTANVFAAEAARRLCGMAGSWSLRPEHVRLQGGGEVQVQGVVQAVQYQGAATRIELRLADGDKLLVSQANIDGAAAASVPRTGQIVQASWSRSAMTPLESGG